MSQQTIGIGTVANDGTGDTLRVAGDKINDNFTELYGFGRYMGYYDASGNTFPVAGSGTAGAVLAGDFWSFSVAATSLDGEPWPIKTIALALESTPGQTVSKWRLF